MFERHPGTSHVDGHETQLKLCAGLHSPPLEAPVDSDAMGRIDRSNAAPLMLIAILVPLIPTATGGCLKKQCRPRCASRAGTGYWAPPAMSLVREEFKRTLSRHRQDKRPEDGGDRMQGLFVAGWSLNHGEDRDALRDIVAGSCHWRLRQGAGDAACSATFSAI